MSSEEPTSARHLRRLAVGAAAMVLIAMVALDTGHGTGSRMAGEVRQWVRRAGEGVDACWISVARAWDIAAGSLRLLVHINREVSPAQDATPRGIHDGRLIRPQPLALLAVGRAPAGAPIPSVVPL